MLTVTILSSGSFCGDIYETISTSYNIMIYTEPIAHTHTHTHTHTRVCVCVHVHVCTRMSAYMYGGAGMYSCPYIIPLYYVLVCAVYLHTECSFLCMYVCMCSVLNTPM